MRMITLHCDYIKYKPLKKAIKNPENLDSQEEQKVKDPLVVLTAVENGDSHEQVKQYVAAIQKTAEEVKAKNIVLYPYAHLSNILANPDTALEYMNLSMELLKKHGYSVSRAPFGYYKEFELKVKGHPLSELSKEFRSKDIPVQHEKPLQSKEKKIILDRRNLKPNDHRILGEDLGIFYLSDEIGPGLPLWLPKGEIIRNQLLLYARELEEKYGYQYVSTPHITKGQMYEKTGHLPYYADTMFSPLDIEGTKYYLKPMNCPHHHMIFNKIIKSYRDLPIRLAEAGTVYRNELSGVTYGLMRVRALTQNDAHIYCTKEQLKDEFINVLKLTEEAFKVIGLQNYWFRLSLPDFAKNPDKYSGDPKLWSITSDEIRKAMKSWGKKFVEGQGEAAFYGPKIDIQIKNSQGKEETLATIQVDIVIPERLGITYIDEKGKKQFPIIIHRAPLGSYERFVAFLLEQTSGNLPLWLSPVQVKVISFTDKNNQAVDSLVKEFKQFIPRLRIEADTRKESVQAKVRDAEVQKVPYMIVIGDKEEQSGKLAVRKHGDKKPEFGVSKELLMKEIQHKIETRSH